MVARALAQRTGAERSDHRRRRGRALVGFVTIDATGYLDQLVVAPDALGLAACATRWSTRPSGCRPDGITLLVNTDNARAIRFYERNGFVHAGDDVNPTSGRPVHRMSWQP